MESVAIEVLGGLLGQKRQFVDVANEDDSSSIHGGHGEEDVKGTTHVNPFRLCIVEEMNDEYAAPHSHPAKKMRNVAHGNAPLPPHSFSSELTVSEDEHAAHGLDGHAQAKWRNYASPCGQQGCLCRPWKCPERDCGMAFAQKNTLKKHVVCVHQKKKAFKCDKCDACFGQSGDLNVHNRTVHDEARPYLCPVGASEGCGATFKLRSHMYKHIRVVHQKLRPHKCELCLTAFAEKNDLRRHQKNVHKQLT
ncbi:Protein glass [Porphyridium purpureum]|uniref:Protein glass n=1 Tax=Porphyridium purpureum TaxID=35688 RepID=A0A5J4Z6T0_PORPP|nr:Protein glass [Porphyridium purpureum]|eukprot:POR8225..scf295_1